MCVRVCACVGVCALRKSNLQFMSHLIKFLFAIRSGEERLRKRNERRKMKTPTPYSSYSTPTPPTPKLSLTVCLGRHADRTQGALIKMAFNPPITSHLCDKTETQRHCPVVHRQTESEDRRAKVEVREREG